MTAPHSLIVVGAGISGLCLGLRALDLGLDVRIVTQQAVEDTVSALAAGMISPALEALGDPDPKAFYAHYRTAQKAWGTFAGDVGLMALISHARPASFVFRRKTDTGSDLDLYLTRLKEMGAKAKALSEADIAGLGLGDDHTGFEVEGEWLMESRGVLKHLSGLFTARGGRLIVAEVVKLMPDGVILSDGETLNAAQVVVAGGYGSHRFARDVPSLRGLSPIKGHILNIERSPPEALAGRIVRSPSGYCVYYGGFAKAGATMQSGQSDTDIEPGVVSGLYERTRAIASEGFEYGPDDIAPEAGVRASTPDGLPMIGRDEASGIWVCTGMRRNGWLFGPYAAELLLRQMTRPDADVSDGRVFAPGRFLSGS